MNKSLINYLNSRFNLDLKGGKVSVTLKDNKLNFSTGSSNVSLEVREYMSDISDVLYASQKVEDEFPAGDYTSITFTHYKVSNESERTTLFFLVTFNNLKKEVARFVMFYEEGSMIKLSK